MKSLNWNISQLRFRIETTRMIHFYRTRWISIASSSQISAAIDVYIRQSHVHLIHNTIRNLRAGCEPRVECFQNRNAKNTQKLRRSSSAKIGINLFQYSIVCVKALNLWKICFEKSFLYVYIQLAQYSQLDYTITLPENSCCLLKQSIVR